MTPRRTGKGRGNFAFDRIFKGVGRITTTAETLNAKEFKRRDRMLDRLYEAGQLEALQQLKAGSITATELRQAERAGRLNDDSLVADIALGRRLWDLTDADGKVLEEGAFTRTLPKMGKKSTTRRRYAVAFSQLASIAAAHLPDSARVADLKRVPWAEVLGEWEVSGATRNRVRLAVSAFLSRYLDDKWHPFRRAVVKAMPLYDETPREVDLTAEQFWGLMSRVPEEGVPSFITLAGSGLRVGEYLQSTKAVRHSERGLVAVHFADGKGGQGVAYLGDQWWEYVRAAVPCRIARPSTVWKGVEYDPRYKRLRKWLIAAAKAEGLDDVWIHDLRHLFVQAGVDALPESKVQRAARHKTRAMTGRYAMRKDVGEVAIAVGKNLKAARTRFKRRRNAS